MSTQPAGALPERVFDHLLRRAPVDIFVFDTDLICRYAAPVGDNFLGLPREELVGRPAAEVWPPAGNGLRSALERAVHEAEHWEEAAYRFVHRQHDREQPCCWSVQVEPVAVDGFRGVLVSSADVLQAAEDRETVERLEREQAERNEALLDAVSDLRNLITPLSGYLQVIARRPEMLGRRTAAQVIEGVIFPQIRQLLETIDRLRRPPIYRE